MSDKQVSAALNARQENLLDNLYAAAAMEQSWEIFLQELVEVTDSRSARMLLMNQSANQVLQSVRFNIDDSSHQQYVNYYVNTCPWRLELSKKTPGRLYSTYLDFTCRQDQFYQTEFFNDWAGEQDIHHGICGTVFQMDNQKVQLLVQRTKGQGFYSRAVVEQINQFLPHFRQALRGQYLQASLRQNTHIDNLTRQGRYPFLLLDAQYQLVYCSPGLETLLHSLDISLLGNRISIADQYKAQELQKALQEVMTKANSLLSCERQLIFKRQQLPPVNCFIAPLYAGARQTFWQMPAQLVIYFYDRSQQLYVNQKKLMALFELTEAEAKVCALVAKGYELHQIAELESRSLHTIRTQLKSIFSKTHCSKQSQLVSVVLNSPAVS